MKKKYCCKTWACISKNPKTKNDYPWLFRTRREARISGFSKKYWKVSKVEIREIK